MLRFLSDLCALELESEGSPLLGDALALSILDAIALEAIALQSRGDGMVAYATQEVDNA